MGSSNALSFAGLFKMYVRMDSSDSKSTEGILNAGLRLVASVAAVVNMRWRPIAAVRWAAKEIGRNLSRTCRIYI